MLVRTVVLICGVSVLDPQMQDRTPDMSYCESYLSVVFFVFFLKSSLLKRLALSPPFEKGRGLNPFLVCVLRLLTQSLGMDL